MCSILVLKCEFQQTKANNIATILFTFHYGDDQRKHTVLKSVFIPLKKY